MKPIEYCLDYVLSKLEENWNVPGAADRKHLNNQEILEKFDLPGQYLKHEFFTGIIDILIKDGFAEFIDPDEKKDKPAIKFYEENTIIKIQGFYFLKNEGGYTKRKLNEDAENTRLEKLENHQKDHLSYMTFLTGVLVFSALATLVYYGVELYWKYGWFRCK